MASYPREQIFIGAEPLKSEFSPPSPRRLKPVGGFWTSTLRKNNAQITSDWLNWVQYDYKKAYKHVDNPQVWKIIIEPSVSLLKLTMNGLLNMLIKLNPQASRMNASLILILFPAMVLMVFG